LNASEELVQAIIDGKIDGELAKAALEGKITVGEAQIVDDAQKQVKKDLGKETYESMSPEDIGKLIETKVSEAKQELEGKAKESEDMRDFEHEVKDFIDNTSDFAEYAKGIDEWLDEHDTTDIRVAYYAVKGEVSEAQAKKQAEIDRAEAEKNAALNQGGGGTKATHISGDSDIFDKLVSGKANPNNF